MIWKVCCFNLHLYNFAWIDFWLQSLIIFTLLDLQAVDLQMEINEGEKFTEDVKIDAPAHLDRAAVDMLNDFKSVS